MKKEYKTPVMKVVAVATRRVILGTSDPSDDSLPISGNEAYPNQKAWSKEDNGEGDFGW